jgi:hypothetical protein
VVSLFCLRLAFGLIACLLLLSPSQVNPRFFRTHFLTALGLISVAGVFLYVSADMGLWLALGSALVFCFAGSVVWLLDGAPAGRTLIVLSALTLLAALAQASLSSHPADDIWLLADDLASAALLGSATTAMLIGHSYLIAPAMSLTPLLRLLAALGAATLVRMILAAAGLWLWTRVPDTVNVDTEAWLWLPVRWGLGLFGPLFLGWMAWQTARIRSTQSATGILYVVVILCFLGELTGQLLLDKTRFIL